LAVNQYRRLFKKDCVNERILMEDGGTKDLLTGLRSFFVAYGEGLSQFPDERSLAPLEMEDDKHVSNITSGVSPGTAIYYRAEFHRAAHYMALFNNASEDLHKVEALKSAFKENDKAALLTGDMFVGLFLDPRKGSLHVARVNQFTGGKLRTVMGDTFYSRRDVASMECTTYVVEDLPSSHEKVLRERGSHRFTPAQFISKIPVWEKRDDFWLDGPTVLRMAQFKSVLQSKIGQWNAGIVCNSKSNRN
jgi:hypothetical protein